MHPPIKRNVVTTQNKYKKTKAKFSRLLYDTTRRLEMERAYS